MTWPEANRDFYARGLWHLDLGDGLIAHKYPTDLWIYTEIIDYLQPAVIVETGTAGGGSAAWFAQWAEVISVDLVAPQRALDNVTFIAGDSVEAAPAVAEMVGERACLVTLDSDHHAAHVLAEIQAYAPIATEYLVVEDTAVDAYGIDLEHYPHGGPGKAVQAWLEGHPEWKADPDCDRLLLGMNPGGWLRRA